MKNNSYLKSHRKKSLASFFLAVLLMFTFNSSPIILLNDTFNTASAYKSSDSQTYYSTTESKEEKGFGDANFPSYLSDSLSGNKNFNIYTEYTKRFEDLYQQKVDAFFEYYGDSEYQNAYINFLSHFGVEKLSDLYTKEKDGNFLKLNLKNISFQCFAETLATTGFTDYDLATDSTKAMPSIITGTIAGEFNKLSEFYRLLADYTINGPSGSGTLPDDIDHPNASIVTPEAFYKSNTHYVRYKNHLDKEIAKSIPISAFNGLTDANIAAIFAKDSDTVVKYNYAKNSYDKYVTPSVKYEVSTSAEKVTKNSVYYFGDVEDIYEDPEYIKNVTHFVIKPASDKETVDMFYYKLITAEDEHGYIEGHPTYYKYTGTSTPFVKTNSGLTSVFVLNDTPTQSELDTYASVYFTHITTKELNNIAGLYVNIPVDELYYSAVYGNLLHSKKGFSYESFKEYFTDGNLSRLYFKTGSEEYRYVYIDEKDESKFKIDYPDYKYKLKTFNSNTDENPNYNKNDYELIVSSSSTSSYIPKAEEGKGTYNLYFAKEIQYYTKPADSVYSNDYEKTYKPVVNLEQDKVASVAYETISDESDVRKIFVLNEENQKITLGSVEYDCIKQADINSKPNFYVQVPASLYPNNIDSNIYKLYYMHTETSADKIYIVDNADNAQDNAIYKTLNYHVIKSTEFENNYSNYLAIAEGDINYNKNFQLYYKYDRSPVTSKSYVLKDDLNTHGLSAEGTTFKNRLVGSGELSDYILIDRTTPEGIEEYSLAQGSLGFKNVEDFRLYYKLSDVFVQNELKNANAIYVIDTSLNSTDKEDYTQHGYTPISQKDIDNNPGLYVALTEKDPNWRNQKDMKLYYKYIQSDVATNTVYAYDQIDTKAEGFDKNAYELIPEDSQGYVEGQENYYKKTLIETKETKIYNTPAFYYYQTSKTVSLTANSYYVLSFYVQTIGDDARASFYIKDTSNIISDIKLDNISTNGAWEKYHVYISTNVNTASTVHLYLYLGDEVNGIKGNTGKDKITASIFFDEIKITKIGLTDYNKLAIDEKPVYSTALTTGEGDDKQEIDGAYADEYNNRVYIANLESVKSTDARFTSNVYEYKNFLDSTINVYGDYSWNDMFQFDTANSDLKNLLGYDSNEENSTPIQNTLLNTMTYNDNDIDGYNMYDQSFTSLWRYYISRDLSNDFSIEKYRQAYKNGKLDVSITNKIEESEKEDDDKEDEDKKDEDTTEETKDVTYVSSPFNNNNYALKLKNTHKDISLGITSNSFTVKQFEYYKISLWIYSPDLDGTATLSVNSVMKTRQSPTYGTLLSSSITSTYANVNKTSSKSHEYGWIPVTLFIEGNNYQDMECYLVLSASAETTVYFDNIRIEKTTSAKFDDAKSNSSSNKYTCALSLIPSTSINTTDIKNGSFDYIKETSFEHNVTSDEPYTPDSWTNMTTNSKRVVAGVVSTQQTAFFNKYSGGNIPYEGSDNFSNIYAIYAPAEVTPLDGSDPISYKHNYSIYSGSLSLSANAIYQITFKFYKSAGFKGNLISNIYLSSVKTANIATGFVIDNKDLKDGWQTYTYYLATGTSTSTAYVEIGVQEAQGISFLKTVTSKKLTGKTLEGIIADVAKENNIDSNTTNINDALKNYTFFSMKSMDFNYHTPNINENTNMFDQKVMTNKTELSTKYTIGQNGVVVAKYFDTNYTTTYSVTINKITYYIGEVYKTSINDVEYYVHKTYNSERNMFEYTIYSDDGLTNKVTTINDEDAIVDLTDGVKVKVGSINIYDTTTTYRLFRFSDLTEEVRILDGSEVTVPSLDKVILGSGKNEKENTATSVQTASYEYKFNSATQTDYVFNNTIIPASELNNAQSSSVLILSNNYATDYITLSQSSANTLGKSTYNVLRIYVKTSDFASDDFGLNIKIKAINKEWTNINTTKIDESNKDKFGFVCYEVLIRSNTTDSISDFVVQLSLGDAEKTGAGYAIISKISLTALANVTDFEHYSDKFDDDNEFVQKAIFAEKASNSSNADDKENTDDENSVSWATFFYIFSSLLLVITMAVAMIAVFIKKNPIKFTQKYTNDHDRDIETVAGKKSSKKAPKNEIEIGELSTEPKKPKNTGGIE